jgi:uncharacterized repeat protein (TIGR04076 family)
MTANQETLEGLKKQLGYDDAQWELWKSNPNNMKIAQKLGDFEKYRVVAEVIKSHGCALGHRVGDKLIFSGMGAYVGKEPPGPVCVGALSPLAPFVNGVLIKIAEGSDPQQLLLNRVKCVDVGIENGGWGEVLFDIRVEKV